MEEKKEDLLYLVAKLQKTVQYTSPLTGQIIHVEVDDCEGYLPVFKTIEEATLHSVNGKFPVLPIRTTEK